jgi:hypothetical protein
LWPLSDRPPLRHAGQMAQGLVALLGDAAHPMRPYLAQGAGMAIEDAAQLQNVLSMHDVEVPLRLRRYALNRWQRNARVQARSERNGRIFLDAGNGIAENSGSLIAKGEAAVSSIFLNSTGGLVSNLLQANFNTAGFGVVSAYTVTGIFLFFDSSTSTIFPPLLMKSLIWSATSF